MFLPDRYVRGECPSCGAEDQYGDSCAACGATYAPSELVNPRSILSGRPPVTRESEHKFFRLGEFESLLKTWMQASNLDRGARNKLAEWFREGLKDWDITRDEPYFGFEVPGEKGKYFYVWLDAPVGYMASFRNLCGSGEEGEERFERYFGADSDAELYHFIGKDILYFHALFWPAVLLGAGMRTPSGVFVHGFLTVDGQKMSKSKGTFITAADYLAAGLDPEYLRYYYAAKLGSGPGRHRPATGGLRRADQFRPGGQAGEHRQPLRQLRAARVRQSSSARACTTRPCTRNSPLKESGSASSTSRARTARPCGRSWPWPIAPTCGSTSTSPGNWPRMQTGATNCTPW